ncbi:putative holin-like toxin [Veillonella sp.]
MSTFEVLSLMIAFAMLVAVTLK